MWQNYFRITVLHLLRQKFYTGINILGLTFGLTCSFLLFLYIGDEISFDRHYNDYQQIYRIKSHLIIRGEPATTTGMVSGMAAPYLAKDFPEIEQVTRLLVYGRSAVWLPGLEKKLYEEHFTYADRNIFEVLNQHFIAGDPKTALKEARKIVLTEEYARYFFGTPQKAMGKEIRIDDEDHPYQVSGVIKNLPGNVSYRFKMLTSLRTIEECCPSFLDNWGSLNTLTFLRVKKGTHIKKLNEKFKPLFKKYVSERVKGLDIRGYLGLQALKDMHFHSSAFKYDPIVKGSLNFIYTLMAVAIFVLAIAVINYINLTTARYSGRAREVGIRKVIGAKRYQLMQQYFTESILLSLLAFLFSLVLIELSMPFYNRILGKNLGLSFLQNPQPLLVLFGLSVLTGILSGLYPALFLSAFQPVSVLKGKFGPLKINVLLRKFLVVVQFTISITLIICIFIHYRQLDYLNKKELGLQKEQILVLEIEGETCHRYKELKQKINLLPNVLDVTMANITPGKNENPQTIVLLEQGGEMKENFVHNFKTDHQFLRVMGIPLLQGRNFNPQDPGDSLSLIVNEALVKQAGWKDPIGKKFLNLRDMEEPEVKNAKTKPTMQVIGVMKDFHFRSLHSHIEPLAIYLIRDRPFWYPARIFVKMKPLEVKKTVSEIRKVFNQIDQRRPFKASFLDKAYENQYDSEEKRTQILLVFSGLTVFIALLGLMGLAAFTAEQKVKEIGIRKVLGAGLLGILLLLGKDLLWLVFYSLLLAFPLAWILMNEWLKLFAYKISLLGNWYGFVLSGLLAMMLAFLVIILQTYRAANANPVDALKDE